MRILLVQPEYLVPGIGFRLAAMPEPLHLEMVAALTPDEEVRILDLRIDPDLGAAMRAFQPDMVAVTALTPEVYAARDVVCQAKAFSPDVFTLVGGHHASLLPDDFFLPEVDAVAVGEAELVFAELVAAVKADRRRLSGVPNLIWRRRDGQFIHNRRDERRVDLDALPIPRRDLTAEYRSEYFFLFDRPDTSVATGRGCPFRCSFCSVWQFYNGRCSQMSPRRVIDELGTVETPHVTFVDDNFLMNHRRESAIADLIRSEGVKLRFSMECRTDSIARHPELVEKWCGIGLYAILLGLEGASDSTLANVNKHNTRRTNDEALRILRDNGVIVWGAFIVDPDWTEEDFRQLRDYVSEQEITHTQFTVLTPLPGTELHRQRSAEVLTDNYLCYDTLHAVLPTRLPREEFYRNYANLYRQTDLTPYYELVRTGKLTIDDCRRGKQMLEAMTNWRRLAEMDPVIGKLGEPDKRYASDVPAATDLHTAK